MLNHHDISSPQTDREAVAGGSDFLSASTFLKPSFSIVVGARSGLTVHVRLASAAAQHDRPTAQARH